MPARWALGKFQLLVTRAPAEMAGRVIELELWVQILPARCAGR